MRENSIQIKFSSTKIKTIETLKFKISKRHWRIFLLHFYSVFVNSLALPNLVEKSLIMLSDRQKGRSSHSALDKRRLQKICGRMCGIQLTKGLKIIHCSRLILHSYHNSMHLQHEISCRYDKNCGCFVFLLGEL